MMLKDSGKKINKTLSIQEPLIRVGSVYHWYDVVMQVTIWCLFKAFCIAVWTLLVFSTPIYVLVFWPPVGAPLLNYPFSSSKFSILGDWWNLLFVFIRYLYLLQGYHDPFGTCLFNEKKWSVLISKRSCIYAWFSWLLLGTLLN